MITFVYKSDDGEQSPMSISFDSFADAHLDLCLSEWEPDEIEYEEEELFDDY